MVLLQALRYSVREGKGTDKYRRDIQRLLGVNRVMHLKLHSKLSGKAGPRTASVPLMNKMK